MLNYKMRPGIVNVLISYVLKVNNQNLISLCGSYCITVE